MTRGMKCLNPCNLKLSPSFQWEGEIRPTVDPEGVLCTFENILYGIRAATKLLLNYNKLYGINTIRQVITRFAPQDPNGDNNPTNAYIANVVSWVGIGPDSTIDFTNDDLIEDLVGAIARQEQGYSFVGDGDLQEGVQEALNNGGGVTNSVSPG
jgi:hypothetical protein